MGNREEGLPESIGRYRIRALLGEGGMGRVYLAEQKGTQQSVAVKVLRPGLYGDEHRRRFEREAQILGQLHHVGIAAVYDAGTFEGEGGEQPYLAMEYVDGPDILDHMRRAGPRLKDRLEIAAKVCDAVQAAHDAGVIHRDLKPGNILVTESGAPKVLDFGLARFHAADDSLRTRTGQFLGTPHYMSPEQARGGSSGIDAASDIYTLGVIVYQLLTNRLPYDLDEQALPALLRTIIEQEPTPIGSVNRSLRGEVEVIVQKALAKEPGQRYGSAAEMAADIRRYLADEPIRARPPGTWYQLAKFARRHRILVTGVAATFLVLAVSLVIVVRALGRAVNAEGVASSARDTSLELLVRSTDLSRQRGLWQRMLDASEGALTAGHGDETSLRLRIVEANIALNRAAAAEAGLARLAGLPLSRTQRARAKLWQAELAMAGSTTHGPKMLREALDAGLDGADREYALGLLGKTAGEAEAHLDAALQLDPFHFRANAALTGMLMLLGRRDDAAARLKVAELLYPDALTVRFARAYLTGLDGKTQQSSVLAAEASSNLQKEQSELLQASVGFTVQMFRELESLDPVTTGTDPKSTLPKLFAGLGRIAVLQAKFAKHSPDPRDLTLAVPLPLVVGKALSYLPKAWTATLLRNADASARALREVSNRLPIAVFFYLEGLIWMGEHKHDKAYAAFRRAADLPSITGALGEKPLVYAASSAWMHQKFGGGKPGVWLKKAAGAIRRIGTPDPNTTWIMAGIAHDAGEKTAARRLSALALQSSPKNWRAWGVRADITFADQAYSETIKAVDNYLRFGGRDPKILDLRAKALAEAARWAD